MADTRQRTTWGNRFRFFARVLGLIGLLAGMIGMLLLRIELREKGPFRLLDQFRDSVQGANGEFARISALLMAVGVGVLAVILLVELIGGLASGAGRRTAAGTVATVGIVAAVALLVIVNAYSSTHHERFDCTRDKRFTLPPDLAAEFRKLRAASPTTIVVHQTHNFGPLMPTRDSFTKAAEAEVTAKVNDLVDQFREFGPQFRVVVLDKEAYEYRRQLKELTKEAPELLAAINAAPENSIFFHANKRVQRLSFSEFMQLDRVASDTEDEKQANLVLVPQGLDRFARRILMVQERRPKAAVCVVHEWLTTVATEGQDEYSLSGLKKSLNDQGFDVVDIVLKKNWSDNTKELEPAAYSLEETKLERLEGDADSAREALRSAQDDVRILQLVKKAAEEYQKRTWRERAAFYTELAEGTRQREWTELIGAFRKWSAGGRPVTEENEPEFRVVLFAGLAAQTTRAEEQVKEAEKDLQDAEAKLKEAYRDERSLEDRRITDVKEKFKRLVEEVDLLIVPRYTVVNATIGRGVGPTLHTMDKKQVEVVKEFMKAGKPVLACMGSISAPGGPQTDAVDGFEKLLRERGIELGRETILYDAERKAFSAARSGVTLFSGGAAKPPPLILADTLPGSKPDAVIPANPIATALRLSGRTAEQNLALELRAPRPVYLAPGWQDKLPYVGEFLLTPPGAWNEERPFVTADRAGRVTYIPRYDPTPTDDPKRNTRSEERKASFPVGVAMESKIPAAWVNEEYERQQAVAALFTPLDSTFAVGLTVAADKLDRPKQRTVVLGSGHIFSGKELNPPQEKLLVHSVNWLTNRDDRLPRSATDKTPEWSYPRVAMSDRNRELWRAGAVIALPLAVAGLGLFAMMVRRTR
jgi:hypothetical protein